MKQWQQLWAGAALVLSLGTACHAQILVGQTAGFTGQVAAGVKETTDGALLYIDAINAKGGRQRPEDRVDFSGRQIRPQARC